MRDKPPHFKTNEMTILNIPQTASFLVNNSNEVPVRFTSIYGDDFKNEINARLLENKSFLISGVNLGSDACGFEFAISIRISAKNKIKRTSFDSGSKFTKALESIINELITDGI